MLDQRIRECADESDILIVVVDDAGDDSTEALRLVDVIHEYESPHLVVLSRGPSPFEDLARVLGVSSTIVTGRDLALAREDIPAFAGAWGYDIEEQIADELCHTTGGWAGALRVALDARSIADPARRERAVLDYMRPRIVEHLDAHGVLRDGIILAHVDDAPDDVLDGLLRGAIDPLRRALDEGGVLLPGGLALAMPTRLRSALGEAHASLGVAEAQRVHQAIARALVQHSTVSGLGRLARHARAANMWSLLERLWRDHAIDLVTEHLPDAHAAFREIPAAERSRRRGLEQAATLTARLAAPRTTAVRGFTHAGWYPEGLDTDDPSDVVSLSAHLLERGSERRTSVGTIRHVPPRGFSDLAWVGLVRGIVAWRAGTPAHDEIFQRAATEARSAENVALERLALAHLALIRAMDGDLREAEQLLERAGASDREAEWVRDLRELCLSMVRTVLRLENLDQESLSALGDVSENDVGFDQWLIVLGIRAQHGLLFGDRVRELGRVARVARLRADDDTLPARDRLHLDRTYVELLIAAGGHTRAVDFLRRRSRAEFAVPSARVAFAARDWSAVHRIAAEAAWHSGTTTRDRTQLFALMAGAALKSGDHELAATSATRVLEARRSERSLFALATLPPDLRSRLLDLAGASLPSADQEALGAVNEMYPAAGEIIRLTAREDVVLRALAQHPRLADIAAALSVSVNTVKKQTAAVYAKLGVHDRRQALQKASRLGLLTPTELRE